MTFEQVDAPEGGFGGGPGERSNILVEGGAEQTAQQIS